MIRRITVQSLFFSECGITHSNPNLKLFGASDIVPSSWPSIGLLVFTYFTEYAIVNGRNISINHTASGLCSCVLIDRLTILTAANCIKNNATVSVDGKSLNIPTALNEYFPTTESMYTVQLSFNKYTDDYDPIKRHYIQKIPVEKIIIVSEFII